MEHPLATEEQNLLDEALYRALTRLAEQSQSGLRQPIADALWQRIPVHVTESNWHPSAQDVGLELHRTTDQLELITTIMTYLPVGETGFVQIGNELIIPVGSGTTVMPWVKFIVKPGDIRHLYMGTPGSTGGTPGFVFLHMSGEVMPTTAHIGP